MYSGEKGSGLTIREARLQTERTTKNMSAAASALPATGSAPTEAPEAKPTEEKATDEALIEAMKDLFDAGKEMEQDIAERCG